MHQITHHHRRMAGSAVALIAGTLLLAACGGGGGDSSTIKMTLGAGHPAGGAITYTNYAESFLVPEIERRVGEETDYKIEIDEQYGGTVTPLGEVLEGTQTGVIDIGLVPYPFETSKLFLYNASYYVPFGSPDVDVVLKAGRAAFEENPEMSKSLDTEFNQRVLGFAAVGDYGLATNFPVTGVDSMKGKKISGAGPNLPWISPVGATPVQGDLNEWYTGIQTGVYDGAIVFPDAYAGFKLHEVAPHFTKTGFGAVLVGGIHVNNDSFEKLPQEVQKIIEEVSREYENTFAEAVEADQEKALSALKDAGVELVDLPEAERKAWAAQLPNIPSEKAKEADKKGLPGTKVIQSYLNAMEGAGYNFPRDWAIR